MIYVIKNEVTTMGLKVKTLAKILIVNLRFLAIRVFTFKNFHFFDIYKKSNLKPDYILRKLSHLMD